MQNSINEKYISMTTERLYGDIQDRAEEADTQSEIRKFTAKQERIRENLESYSGMIGTLSESNTKLSGVLEKTAEKLGDAADLFDEGSGKMSAAAADLSDAKSSFNDFSANVAAVLGSIGTRLDSLASGISSAQLQADADAVRAYVSDMLPKITWLNEKLDILIDAFIELDPEVVPWETAANKIRNLQSTIELLEENATKVAGSGGTFPIEMLPALYQAVYRFLPFNYAINAMRECVGGMYGSDYLIDIAKLLIFAGVGLVIGLVMMKPFARLRAAVDRSKENSGVML